MTRSRWTNAASAPGARIVRRLNRPQRPEDVVVYPEDSGSYVIATMGGDSIGTSDNRRDAMRRACTAARGCDATVWVCIDAALELYNEVLCP